MVLMGCNPIERPERVRFLCRGPRPTILGILIDRYSFHHYPGLAIICIVGPNLELVCLICIRNDFDKKVLATVQESFPKDRADCALARFKAFHKPNADFGWIAKRFQVHGKVCVSTFAFPLNMI